MYGTWAGLVAFAAGCGGSDLPVVGAAASAEAAMTEAVGRFAAERGGRGVVGGAASSVLVHQVERGMAYDLVLLAHPRWAEALGDRALDRVDLLSNEVVLVGRERGPTLAELPAADCLAMGDPDHVPGGIYARSALQAAGSWPAVQDRIRPTLDAPAAVWAVRHGVCAVGAVYRTDALGPGGVQIGQVLEPTEPIRYPLVLLDERGRALFDWLQSDAAWPAFSKRGFTRP